MSVFKERLLELLRDRSFKKGEFTLSSGRKSDFFIDCKRTTLTSHGLYCAGEVLLCDIFGKDDSERIDGLAAVPLGSCSLVDAIAVMGRHRFVSTNILYVRKEKKDHGTKQLIEGMQNLKKDASVVLVEDVVTTGESALRAVNVLNENGINVLYVIALVDRLEGAKENLTAAGVELRSIFTREDFIPSVK
jgi:orotate phosphoribosyltransferase